MKFVVKKIKKNLFQSQAMDLPQARVVLEVTLEGSARKLVTVRSALQIHNQLDYPVEIKLAHSENQNKRKNFHY